ncbi:MAG: ParB N-terminal domain-containing protein [Pseudomonadota bacterium]
MVEPSPGAHDLDGSGSIIEIREVEIAHIDLRYAHTRLKSNEMISSLEASIENSSPITPVITVREGDFSFVLIDGYSRVRALSRCGKDTVLAEIWACKEWEAILRVLMKTRERKWQALEQALMIRELTERHNLSQVEIAHLMGRHQSWVSRRLSLLDALSEDIVDLVQEGCISSWAAARVLAPMARAIPEHAKILADNLVKEPISTRDLMDLFHHYQKANRKQRERMVHQPILYLKALRSREEEQQGLVLKDGPEGRWLKDIKMAAHILRRLIKDLPLALYAGQSNLDQRTLLTAFKDVKDLFLSLEKAIKGVCQP